MYIEFTYSLTEKQKQDWISFYKSFSHISVMQYIGWFELYQPNKKVCYCICRENDIVKAVCAILENKIIADVYWGPVANTEFDSVNCIKAIHSYYKKKYFALIRINLQDEVSEKTKAIELSLKETIPFEQKLGEHNWSSIKINLNQSFEEIEKSFSTNHKRSIKKAQKEELFVAQLVSSDHLNQFAAIYVQMHKERNIVLPIQDPNKTFNELACFFKDNENGMFLGVFDSSQSLLGAIALSFEGQKAFYLFGASDPSMRKLPILHLAFYEALKIAKERKLSYFDFGGYNHDVDDTSQVYQINRFKQGFGGEFVHYPLQLQLTGNRLVFGAYKILQQLRHSRK